MQSTARLVPPCALLVFAALPLACARGGGDGAPSDVAPDPVADGGGALEAATGTGTDGGTGDATGDTDASIQAACADRENAYCGQLARCASFLVSTQYGDVGTCVAQRTAVCLDTMEAPGSGWTTDAMHACSRAIASLPCADFLRGKPAPNPCRVSGLTDTGAACRYDGQCRTGYCRAEDDGQCGNCVALGLTGAPCSTFADCDGDLVCASSGTCQPPAGAGASCDDARPCRIGLACVAGTCAVAGAAGAACQPDAGGGCDVDQGLVCNALTSRCARLGVVRAGQSCGSGSAACYGGAVCAKGSCVGPAHIGDACDSDSAASCGALGTCTGGVCQPFKAADCQ